MLKGRRYYFGCEEDETLLIYAQRAMDRKCVFIDDLPATEDALVSEWDDIAEKFSARFNWQFSGHRLRCRYDQLFEKHVPRHWRNYYFFKNIFDYQNAFTNCLYFEVMDKKDFWDKSRGWFSREKFIKLFELRHVVRGLDPRLRVHVYWDRFQTI